MEFVPDSHLLLNQAPWNEKKPLWGFDFAADGLEIFHLDQDRWMVISCISFWKGTLEDWIANRFLKALETIPTQDHSVCYFFGNRTLLTEQLFPVIFQKRPKLPFVIYKPDGDPMIYLLERNGSPCPFEKFEFELIKNCLHFQGWTKQKEGLGDKVSHFYLSYGN